MSRLRNPFRMRASEKIESEANFLYMYSPSILDSLLENHQQSKLWDNITYIHSSPGGGKTSLLRIFEPSVLNALYFSQTHYKDIYSILKKIDVFDDNRINVLGVYLLCSRSFEILEDMNVSDVQKRRLFNSLLNSRLIISVLKSILIFKNKKFPEDLSEIHFSFQDMNNYFQGLKTPCSGDELYSWAAKSEERIFSALDSLIPISEKAIPGHNELFSFFTMNPENFKIKGEDICLRFLFMLDDAHKLTYDQRKTIKEELIEKRGCFTLWIAERIEVLEPRYALDHKNIPERDYQNINIEDFFREKDPKSSKFATLLSSVAEKRASLSSDNLNTFQDHLTIVLNEEKYKANFIKAIEDSKVFFKKIQTQMDKFNYWIDFVNSQKGGYEEIAILMKQTEILINRNLKKQQLSLDFDMDEGELLTQIGGELKTAAIYFISQKYGIPFYYGFSNLVRLSSYNIEQFLSFSSELFERMLSNKLLGNNISLGIEEQDKVIRDIVFNRWKGLSSSIPYSSQVIKFLNKLGQLCQEESNKPNAPYAPGVTGFAIRDNDPNLFGNNEIWYESSIMEPLVNILTTCVSFNILEARKTNQGSKGQIWTVYYLNRWLCVHFNLPLSYGGWRPKSPQETLKWIK